VNFFIKHNVVLCNNKAMGIVHDTDREIPVLQCTIKLTVAIGLVKIVSCVQLSLLRLSHAYGLVRLNKIQACRL